jgi:hypothetical protein
MKWTVVWLPSAEDDLAAAWLAAPDRQEITDAAQRLERDLQNDPDLKGEDFYGDRIYQYGPLAVAYMLFSDDHTVKVMQVMRIKT